MKIICDRYRASFDRISAAAIPALLVALAAAATAHASVVPITQDTTIDSANSYPDDHVEISGSTSVKMIAGGTVRGFSVLGSSVFEITGGESTILSGTSDSATLVMRGGKIGCTAAVCQVIDYPALVTMTDASSLQFFGGTIEGVISLEDQSTAHFYGTGLSLSSATGGIVVQGTFGGAAEFFAFNNTPTTAARIFLHEVPETPTSVLVAFACLVMTGFGGRQRWNAWSFRL
jgi:hypothetical protein